jgi:hypothetical protein
MDTWTPEVARQASGDDGDGISQRYRSDETCAIHEAEGVARHRRDLVVWRSIQRRRQRGNQLSQRRGRTVRDERPEGMRGRRDQVDVTRLGMEHNPIFRVVVVRPDEVDGWTPALVVCQPHADPASDVAQLPTPPPA